jgi:hypothetical protein
MFGMLTSKDFPKSTGNDLLKNFDQFLCISPESVSLRVIHQEFRQLEDL